MPLDTGTPVLLVDASPAFRTAVRAMMRRSRRFRLVGEAATASDAMILAARQRPGLVLLDVDLPDGSGVQAGLWMRRLMPPPVVLLCSTCSLVDLPREVRASGLPYLDKSEVTETALTDFFPRPTRFRAG